MSTTEHAQGQLIAVAQQRPGKDDYYTPREFFDALDIRFDLDVCAPPGGVRWVPADRFLTVEDDGLVQPWDGRVWMNPPYSNCTPWVRRFIDHRHGIALLPHAKSAWHPKIYAAADGVAMPWSYPDFVGGPIAYPVFFAAFGRECVDALRRIGPVRTAP